MIRRDTFDIEIDVSLEEAKDGIFYATDSTVTFEAYIDDSGPATAIVHVKPSYAELLFEDEDGNDVILSKEDMKQAEEKAFDMSEERAQERAWEERYEDR
tara:strand:- start:524 stop:823 length:300 start_codon:yes stop_codon:yes gene_type:complete